MARHPGQLPGRGLARAAHRDRRGLVRHLRHAPALLAPDVLPQVFNFELVTAQWDALAIRKGIDATLRADHGSRAPWVIGNHDVVRPVTRWGVAPARAAALLLLALPGSAYIYQGEELGLPEVLDIPDAARQDPDFPPHRREGSRPGRVPGAVAVGEGRGFVRIFRNGPGFLAGAPMAPAAGLLGRVQRRRGTRRPVVVPPPVPGGAAAARGEPRARRRRVVWRWCRRCRCRSAPAAPAGEGAIRWLDAPDDALVFARDPGFVFAANLGSRPLPLPRAPRGAARQRRAGPRRRAAP